MRKCIPYVLAFALLSSPALAAEPSHAGVEFTGTTKQEAIEFISVSMSDPEVKQWVVDAFKSEKLFFAALKVAPEGAVLDSAQRFADFQKVGGENAGNPTGLILASIALALALVVFVGTVAAL